MDCWFLNPLWLRCLPKRKLLSWCSTMPAKLWRRFNESSGANREKRSLSAPSKGGSRASPRNSRKHAPCRERCVKHKCLSQRRHLRCAEEGQNRRLPTRWAPSQRRGRISSELTWLHANWTNQQPLEREKSRKAFDKVRKRRQNMKCLQTVVKKEAKKLSLEFIRARIHDMPKILATIEQNNGGRTKSKWIVSDFECVDLLCPDSDFSNPRTFFTVCFSLCLTWDICTKT